MMQTGKFRVYGLILHGLGFVDKSIHAKETLQE
jgi:hypothetical protein